MIEAARGRALAAVNTALVDLYWRVGEYISRKLETAAWGEGVVEELARYIQRRHPNIRGFTRRNLFRMRQFFEAYRGDEKVSALLTQLPWTHHLANDRDALSRNAIIARDRNRAGLAARDGRGPTPSLAQATALACGGAAAAVTVQLLVAHLLRDRV